MMSMYEIPAIITLAVLAMVIFIAVAFMALWEPVKCVRHSDEKKFLFMVQAGNSQVPFFDYECLDHVDENHQR